MIMRIARRYGCLYPHDNLIGPSKDFPPVGCMLLRHTKSLLPWISLRLSFSLWKAAEVTLLDNNMVTTRHLSGLWILHGRHSGPIEVFSTLAGCLAPRLPAYLDDNIRELLLIYFIIHLLLFFFFYPTLLIN